jgi:hypothetical protein
VEIVISAMLLCLSLCTAFLFFSSAKEVSTSSNLSGECVGSITLHQEGNQESVSFTEDNEELQWILKVSSADLESCGESVCFRLYQKKNGKGRSYFVETSGPIQPAHWVQSIRKKNCRWEGYPIPLWLAIILFVILILIVGSGTMYVMIILCN